jgi:hypothetical protein
MVAARVLPALPDSIKAHVANLIKLPIMVRGA